MSLALLLLVTSVLALPVAAATTTEGAVATTGVVLLDEYWTPEIVQDGATVSEVDTLVRQDSSQARTGECSAEITNETGGSPNVRFRGAGLTTLAKTPPDTSEASLWYRTDRWTGTWCLEVWVYHRPTSPAPVIVMRASLAGEGPNGALVADDTWHRACGRLKRAGEYERVPKEKPLATYVWLRPETGHGVAHRTFIDRVEIGPAGQQAPGSLPPAPARRVRPRPGALATGAGWIWWEAEDATTHSFPPGGVFAPYTTADQSILSNGMWLQYSRSNGLSASWDVDVAQPGRYSFWCRALGRASFRWRWDGGEWGECVGGEAVWVDEVKLRDDAMGPVIVRWTRLGEVDLSPGRRRLDIEGTPKNASLGLDCWLLTDREFVPRGAAYPEPQAAESRRSGVPGQKQTANE